MPFKPLNVAVLTISDTRDETSDTSGQYLVEALTEAGHHLADKQIVKDDIYQIRAITSKWIASDNIQVIISTGGTGFTGRDSTPEAMLPLFDKTVEGFGELFRQVSYTDIGTSTIQSRAVAGMANKVVIFCLPGSTGACKTGWQDIIRSQIDASVKPCNFVAQLKTVGEAVEACQTRGVIMSDNKQFSHVNAQGEANMVDVSQKAVTTRTAIAEAYIKMSAQTIQMIVEGGHAKGDVFAVARIAGIQAAKKCADLIPLCHPLMLSKVQVDFEVQADQHRIRIETLCKLAGQTGVEMEALTAASVAALTLFDMCKAVDPEMEIGGVRVLQKEGGKTGHWQNQQGNN